MAHPLLLPKQSFFYPIGNTPAICFTHGFAPEMPLDALLLGCGDPRSILYTTYADLGKNRPIDFTCCDADPAILARNALLFSLIVDGVPSKNTWNIFYHLYLDQCSVDLLLVQCQKLLTLSTTHATWRSSPYGHFLKFCTDRSLSEVRRHWYLYAETGNFTPREKRDMKDTFDSGMRAVLARDGTTTSCRAGGPLWMDLVPLGREHFEMYWSTGTTCKDSNAIFPNAMFAYSLMGQKFNVHYGTDPLMVFHLTAALAPTLLGSKRSSPNVQHLVECARSQFREWCTAFKVKVTNKSTKLRIRLFAGDALAFSRALRTDITNPCVYTYLWGGSLTSLDEAQYGNASDFPAPTTFDIIDTSNLSDHLGILNILVATVPLMRNESTSVLHTNTLLPSVDVFHVGSGFVNKLCADIPTLALLLGIVPIPYISSFTSHSNTHELIIKSSQYHELVAWKKSALTDSLSLNIQQRIEASYIEIDPTKLATLLYNIYLRMFQNENHSHFFQNPIMSILKGSAKIHYDRSSFAALLQLIKAQVCTDWKTATTAMLSLIRQNRTHMISSNYYQDLCVQLHRRGVYTDDGLTINCAESLRINGTLFRNWTNIPPILCIVLQVPRSALKYLEAMPLEKIGTPVLQCTIRGTFSQNIFSGIQPVFGTMFATGSDRQTVISIVEDSESWAGSSPLIFSFYIPAATLTYDPFDATYVELSLASTIATVSLIPKLGVGLTIFSASLNDRKHVQIVCERPHNPHEVNGIVFPVQTQSSTGVSSPLRAHPVTVSIDKACESPSLFTLRADVVGPAARSALSSKAVVTTKQVSTCSMAVKLGDTTHILAFPFPINGGSNNLRIARKSSYIEVDVQLATPILSPGCFMKPFLLIPNKNSYNLWDIHYLNLDILPSLDLHKKMDWLVAHLGQMLSERELRAKRAVRQLDRGTMVNLKQSIASVFLGLIGIPHGKREAIFGLSHPESGGVYTFIFVNNVRLDLASHTVVADACALPLTDDIMPKIRRALQKLVNRRFITIVTLPDEIHFWKHLLPCLAERCRKWTHQPNCEYRKAGAPLSVKFNESPFCRCGQGKDLGSKFLASEWKDLSPFLTRIALSPLWPASCLENMAGGGSIVAAVDKVNERVKLNGQNSHSCANCGSEGLLACSACKSTRYCSKYCQTVDWKLHKPQCGKQL